MYQDGQFADLFCARCGQSAYSPGQLALVMVMQFMEGLSDRQAAEAVRSRIDWKYALGLALTDEGFDHSVLSEFRGRLIAGGQEAHLLDELLRQAQARGWVKGRGKQRTDSTHVLAAVRQMNRLEVVGETLRHCLNVLATGVPEWLVQQVDASWFERYSERVEQARLSKDKAEQAARVLQVGRDGHQLLASLATTVEVLRQIPAVEVLRQVWVQQYYLDEAGVHWREAQDLPPHQQQTTPEFQQRYARRAGIEGTLSQGVRAFGLRRTRYLGLAKTHLQNVAIATAINLTRLAAHFDLIPRAETRTAHFAALAPFFSG